jgi:hypothetical protein
MDDEMAMIGRDINPPSRLLTLTRLCVAALRRAVAAPLVSPPRREKS